jgi:hypothetical protein
MSEYNFRWTFQHRDVDDQRTRQKNDEKTRLNENAIDESHKELS